MAAALNKLSHIGSIMQTETAMTEKTPNSDSPDATSQDLDPEKRTKFGTRYLTDAQNVFQHNAWDNVVWDEEQETMAQQIMEKHVKSLVPANTRDQYEDEADQFWDKFYGQHQNRFFKDRHWLFTEFPELYGNNRRSASSSQASCTDLPPSECDIEKNDSKGVRDNDVEDGEKHMSRTALHASSSQESQSSELGIEQPLDDLNMGNTDKEQPLKDLNVGNTDIEHTHSFRMLEVGCGVGNTVFPVLKTNNNLNLMVYCCDFSRTAIDIVKNHPDYEPSRCQAFVYDLTDDGASVPFPLKSLDVIIMIFVLSAVHPDKMQDALFRLASYLKPGGILLFRDYGRYDLAQLRFKEDELKELFTKAGLEEKENLVDRRLQVNRGRQLKMYRVWIQCKYMKPISDAISKSPI